MIRNFLEIIKEEEEENTCENTRENTTVITQIETTSIQEEIQEDIINDIADFSFSLETRIQYLETLFLSKGEENTIEYINRLICIYENSRVKILEEYLLAICKNQTFSVFLKIIAVKSLCKISSSKGPYVLNEILLSSPKNIIPTPLKLELITLLLSSTYFSDQAIQYAIDIITNQSLDCKYRYKILDIIPEVKVQLSFFFNETTEIFYKILASQCILQNTKLEDSDRISVEIALLTLASDNEIQTNIRADCADILISLGRTEKHKSVALAIINEIGGHKQKNVYDNEQNVHSKFITKSTLDGIKFLATFQTLSNNTAKNNIYSIINEHITITLGIQKAITRLEEDRILYENKYKLQDIFLNLWEYISHHSQKPNLIKRLEQELEEMAETCSSGYATRLVNTMSGFGDFYLNIGWEDQIYSYFKIEIEKKIHMLDEIERDLILAELSDSSNSNNKSNLMKFYIKNVTDIRNLLFSEFKQYISLDEFELYFREAMSKYESN